MFDTVMRVEDCSETTAISRLQTEEPADSITKRKTKDQNLSFRSVIHTFHLFGVKKKNLFI